MPRHAHDGLRPNLSAAQRYRDAAFARVARVRRAAIFGAAALTAGLAGLVSALAPGRTLGAKVKVRAQTASVTPRRAGAASAQMPPLAKPSQLGLRPPASAPQSGQTSSTQSTPAQPPPAPPAPPAQQTVPAPAPAPSGGGAVVSGGS